MNKRGAPKGSRNAAKERPGTKMVVYLNAEMLDILDEVLREDEVPIANKNRFALARTLLASAIWQLRDRHNTIA